MARACAAPPVTICLEGVSMRPLIRKGRDPVTIVPMQLLSGVGDVVLFTLGDGRCVVHCVWKLRMARCGRWGSRPETGALVPHRAGAGAGDTVQEMREGVSAGYRHGLLLGTMLDGHASRPPGRQSERSAREARVQKGA